jgi:hypothetical protein
MDSHERRTDGVIHFRSSSIFLAAWRVHRTPIEARYPIKRSSVLSPLPLCFIARRYSKHTFNLADCCLFLPCPLSGDAASAPLAKLVPNCSFESGQVATIGQRIFDGCLGKEGGVCSGWPSGYPYFLDSWLRWRRDIHSSICWGVPA